MCKVTVWVKRKSLLNQSVCTGSCRPLLPVAPRRTACLLTIDLAQDMHTMPVRIEPGRVISSQQTSMPLRVLTVTRYYRSIFQYSFMKS